MNDHRATAINVGHLVPPTWIIAASLAEYPFIAIICYICCALTALTLIINEWRSA